MNDQEAINLVFSRMKWEDQDKNEKTLRIVTQSNLDCIFEIRTSDPENKDPNQRYLHLLSAVKIDNLHTDYQKIDSNHYFYEPYPLDTSKVVERLIRMNQNYKTVMQHAINRNSHTGPDQLKTFMLEQIHRIDYQ